MKIVFIGAGRLATHLAKALYAAGHDIVQVYSRTIESASYLAMTTGGKPTTDISTLTYDADIYIFAVSDSVLSDLIPQICKGREQKVFIHTAGSIPMDAFATVATHFGVLYPMQTFTKGRDIDFSTIPCFIEAGDDYAQNVIAELAESISNEVRYLSSDDRKYLHLAAVFTCNFVNHCFAISSDILAEHNIPFSVMYPLIDETISKIHEIPPVEAQTGPAVRYDKNVIHNQSTMLEAEPLIKDIYERMSMSIHKKAQIDDKLRFK